MIPHHNEIDLYQITPDGDDIDLFSVDFRLGTFPDLPGCYAFYDRHTHEVMYVGVAAGWGGWGDGCGLRQRMSGYRNVREKHKNKTKDTRGVAKENGWLVKYWTAASRGDALKAEADTIAKHCPKFNDRGFRQKSPEEINNRYREYRRRKRARDIQKWTYDPNRLKVCGGKCKQEKPCSEFHLQPHSKFGVYYACRECTSERQRERRRKI